MSTKHQMRKKKWWQIKKNKIKREKIQKCLRHSDIKGGKITDDEKCNTLTTIAKTRCKEVIKLVMQQTIEQARERNFYMRTEQHCHHCFSFVLSTFSSTSTQWNLFQRSKKKKLFTSLSLRYQRSVLQFFNGKMFNVQVYYHVVVLLE